MKRTLLISSLLLIGAACRAEPAAERAYAQLNSRLVAAKSLTGTLDLDQVGRKTAYTFRFLRPNYSSIVSDRYESHGDGKTEWFYMRKTRQFESEPAKKEISGGIPLFGLEAMLQGKAPKDYTVGSLSEGTFAGKRCRVLSLTPRASKAAKLSLYLDASGGLPVGYRFQQPGNSPKDPPVTMTGTYSGLRLDAPLTPRAFAWKPPAGAKKLDYTADLLKVGSPAPAFTLKTPEGTGVSLASTVGKNKATLVAFWFYG